MIIYAYTTETYKAKGWIKVGETRQQTGKSKEECARERIAAQDKTSNPEPLLVLWAEEVADVSDRQIHAVLRQKRIPQIRKKREWFKCEVDDVKRAIHQIKFGTDTKNNYPPRPEQEAAANAALSFFQDDNASRKRFLWNAKMRFGKTFSTYLLAEKLNAKRILILTYKPAAERAWRDDLLDHKRFAGWKFIAQREDKDQTLQFDDNAPTVVFASFQLLMKNHGAPFADVLFGTSWDLLVTDEAHYGTETEKANELIAKIKQAPKRLDLSGTPFRLLNDGTYEDDRVFSWSYMDEQAARQAEIAELGEQVAAKSGVYFWLPPMHIHTFRPGEKTMAMADYYDAEEHFTAAKFFKAEEGADGGDSAFVNHTDVLKFLDELCSPSSRHAGHNIFHEVLVPSGLRDAEGNEKFQRVAEKHGTHLRHTFWFLPGVKECNAMEKLMTSHPFFSAFNIVVAAGDNGGEGGNAMELVEHAVASADVDGEHAGKLRGSITLSCGKLNTGVTVPEWSAVLILNDTKSDQEYFQTIFRAQSPWQAGNKRRCFVFDFNPNRVLRHIYSYAQNSAIQSGSSPEQGIREMLAVMNVFCHEDGVLARINENDVFDSALSGGVMRSMLARKFLSDRLINSSALGNLDDTGLGILAKITNEANVDEFKETVQTIIAESALANGQNSKSTNNNEADADSGYDEDDVKLKKETRDKLVEIKRKLKRLCSRLPLFMYLTEEREADIYEVIAVQEPLLFEVTTGITQADFKHIMDLGLLRREFLDQCVAAFRRFEEPSLSLFEEEK